LNGVDAESTTSGIPSPQAVRQTHAILNNAEREKLHIALAQVNGNRSRAAKVLGISHSTIYEKLKQYRLGDDHTPSRFNTVRS
jgi:transcriptional regulator of acetoin/glycerol metabolism